MTAPTTVEIAIYNKLKDTSAVFKLVNNRIYAVVASQNTTRPFITYERSTTRRIPALGADTGDVIGTFQISAWSLNRDEAVTIALEVKNALKRFRGTQSGIVITEILMQNEVDLFDSKTKLHQVSMDFDIWSKE